MIEPNLRRGYGQRASLNAVHLIHYTDGLSGRRAVGP